MCDIGKLFRQRSTETGTPTRGTPVALLTWPEIRVVVVESATTINWNGWLAVSMPLEAIAVTEYVPI